MWKHPSGVLCYFDTDKGEAKVLVDCLRPYIPRDPVYPTEMADWPPVEFTLGMPDFTMVDYPIRGDFPRGYFTRGAR
jgi:hypothetical protein